MELDELVNATVVKIAFIVFPVLVVALVTVSGFVLKGILMRIRDLEEANEQAMTMKLNAAHEDAEFQKLIVKKIAVLETRFENLQKGLDGLKEDHNKVMAKLDKIEEKI